MRQTQATSRQARGGDRQTQDLLEDRRRVEGCRHQERGIGGGGGEGRRRSGSSEYQRRYRNRKAAREGAIILSRVSTAYITFFVGTLKRFVDAFRYFYMTDHYGASLVFYSILSAAL